MPLYQFVEPFSVTVELIKSILEYRKSTTKKERETPEWKSLEKHYINHLEWRLKYPSKVFGQQLISSWLITIIVLLLVLSGLTFSFVQLYSSLKLGDLSGLKTELAIQTAGKVSISSSVVGAVVLVISLAFFYLYLKHVFQIKHPVPPHVSLTETDASTLFRRGDTHGTVSRPAGFQYLQQLKEARDADQKPKEKAMSSPVEETKTLPSQSKGTQETENNKS